jgi:hypothetical protein
MPWCLFVSCRACEEGSIAAIAIAPSRPVDHHGACMRNLWFGVYGLGSSRCVNEDVWFRPEIIILVRAFWGIGSRV